MTAFYQRLQNETEQARQQLLSVPVIQDCFEGKVSLESYRAFLVEAFHHVKHTVPLLMACGSRLSDDKEWIRAAVVEYIEEEYGHHEWILNDIAATGGDKERVRNGKPSPSIELMVSYLYDVIARNNPLCLFGMVHVLEGTSVALATNAAGVIAENLMLPRTAFSYLESHGSLDIEHLTFFENLMNKIEDPQDQQDIIDSAKVVYRLYADMFRGLPRTFVASQAA